ncbi:CAP-associated domain-containing protein [Oceanobacillus sp. CFH 90083]|uniref:CAP domain-containing protein n=1 Tax=Oceanobacillus sp. CFH 90083 TaxID=2592336 RepID=UPI00128C5D83|nr:CAP-associated domain-containing protein [Oceanobacillus sp. CFH 90083]
MTELKKVGIAIFKRLLFLLLIILLAIWTKPLWEEPVRDIIPDAVSDTFSSAGDFINDVIDNDFYFRQVSDQTTSFFNSMTGSETEREYEQVETPELTTPEEQSFSIGNVEIGDTRNQVEEVYGEAERQSENEYGVEWFTYHENYQNFMMVAYDEQEMVRGLFTNQDLLSSQHDIALGDPKTFVNETLGEPEEMIRNGWFNYKIESEGEYDVYHMDGTYVTMFYDLHEADEVTAVQLIDEDLESAKSTLYTPGSEALKEGLEYQLFDLTNATRVKQELSILEWDEAVRETARKHSTDMAVNQFFSHTNLQNQSPFERMEADDIAFTSAGENLAYGQFSSIFAHQGLLNSLGHRENILHEDFTHLGVGVDFNESDQPFYTENFFSNRLY